jgi:hypothetical protein
MRITRDFIQKFTIETIDRRTRSSRDVLAVYQCGSSLGEAYALGGTSDIDLFFVHHEPPKVEREIVRLTDEIHLDLAHYDQMVFHDTRKLRIDPWFGSALNSGKILYDPQHFLDFVQASVRGQYDRPDHVYRRARPLADRSREIWFHLEESENESDLTKTTTYLEAIGSAANAIACISGPPLPIRRLVIEFPVRAEALERPGLFHGLLGLLGAPNLEPNLLSGWLEAWKSAYQSIPEEKAPSCFHPARLRYFYDAMVEMAGGERPFELLWPLLRTWASIVAFQPLESKAFSNWQTAMERLGLYGPMFKERLQALDAYLDLVEETLETWAQENGAWETA